MSILPSTSHGADCQQTYKYDHDANQKSPWVSIFQEVFPINKHFFTQKILHHGLGSHKDWKNQ